MLNYLYVDFNSFFASCEQQSQPELRGQPVAVVPMMAESTCAIAASYEAKAFGIKTGTIIRDAKQMCPELICVPATHGRYVKYHHKALEIIDTIIPIDKVCSIDEVACKLTGSQKEKEKAIGLADDIKKALAKDLGEYLTVSIGLGPNRLMAKMASDMQKPDGLTILDTDELEARLSPLPIQEIPGIGRRMQSRLNYQNIKTIGDLYKKSSGELRAIWGSIGGLKLYHSLRGLDITSKTESGKSISHEHVLPPVKRNQKESLLTIEKLLLKAAVRLRRANKMAGSLSVGIRYRDRTKWKKEIRFSQTASTQELLKHLNQILLEAPFPNRPIKVGVSLGRFSEAEEGEQLSFFRNNKKEKLSSIIDSINDKYGRDTVAVASQIKEKEAAPTRIAFSRVPSLDEVD